MPLDIANIPVAASTFNAGQPADGGKVLACFKTAYNNDIATKAKVDTLLAGNVPESRFLTVNQGFTGNPTENTGMVLARGDQPNVGWRFNEQFNQMQATNNGSAYYPLLATRLPLGPAPVWTSVDTVALGAGTAMVDDTGSLLIALPGGLTLDFDTAGAGGIDTGGRLANRWYYIWLLMGSDGATTAVLSRNETNPTEPTSFNAYKARLPIALRLLSDGKLLRFVVSGWPAAPHVTYPNLEVEFTNDAGLTTTTPLLLSGAATTFTDVEVDDYVPPIATAADLVIALRSNSVWLRNTTGSGRRYSGVSGVNIPVDVPAFPITPNPTAGAKNKIQYRVSGTTTHIAVSGYHVGEVG